MSAYINKSPWIIRYSGSYCKGCDMEALTCFSPSYDIEKIGAKRCRRPSEADILLITGKLNSEDRENVALMYEQMLDPKLVIAVGNCASKDEIDQIIPIDKKLRGCAVKPEEIMEGIIKALVDGGEDDE